MIKESHLRIQQSCHKLPQPARPTIIDQSVISGLFKISQQGGPYIHAFILVDVYRSKKWLPLLSSQESDNFVWIFH